MGNSLQNSAFKHVFETGKAKFKLNIVIKCRGKRLFRIFAHESGKINSNYAERDIFVEGSRTIFFSFPVTPESLTLCCFDKINPTSKDFELTFEVVPLPIYDIWIDSSTREFLKLATYFSQVCGFTEAPATGTLFESQNFIIKYLPVIRDLKSNPPRVMNTPAQVGHTTGKIDAAKLKFDRYTIAMRMIILLHEYSHVNKNPKIGLEIGNEIGADINALYIYLGLGYSKVDALTVYANIFLKAKTNGNRERMRKISDYINRFETQEFAKKLNG